MEPSVLLRGQPEVLRGEYREEHQRHAVAQPREELDGDGDQAHRQDEHPQHVADVGEKARLLDAARRRGAAAPRQQAFAWALAHHRRQHEDQRHGRRAGDGAAGNAGHRQQGAAQGAVGGTGGHLAPAHEGVGAAALVLGQDVDGHAVHRHVLHRREDIDECASGRQQRERAAGHAFGESRAGHGKEQQREHQASLHGEHPRASKSHRQEREPIHERPADQLERPGEAAPKNEGRDLRPACALFPQPSGDGDGDQANRYALGEVEGAEAAEAQPTRVGEDQGHRRSLTGSIVAAVGVQRRARAGRRQSVEAPALCSSSMPRSMCKPTVSTPWESSPGAMAMPSSSARSSHGAER